MVPVVSWSRIVSLHVFAVRVMLVLAGCGLGGLAVISVMYAGSQYGSHAWVGVVSVVRVSRVIRVSLVLVFMV